jgi:hypothetical protein
MYNITSTTKDVAHNERGANTGMTITHYWGRKGWTIEPWKAVVWSRRDEAEVILADIQSSVDMTVGAAVTKAVR